VAKDRHALQWSSPVRKAYTRNTAGYHSESSGSRIAATVFAVNYRGLAASICGGSYGGYATLTGLSFTPDVFTCGVDIVGPSNLFTLIESFPAYWQPFLEATWYRRVGDPRNEDGRKLLLSRSPISKVDQIRKPLLIAQGANDPRVVP